MTYLGQPDLPRILMLDCADELIASVRGDGYAVEIGYTGFFREHPAVELPANLHEKDLIIIDLEPGWQSRDAQELFPFGSASGDPKADHLRTVAPSERTLDRFTPSFNRGGSIVCLMEGERVVEGLLATTHSFAWLPGSQASSRRSSNDTAFRLPEACPAGLEEEAFLQLTKLFEANEGRIGALRQLLSVAPLLLNDAGEAKAGWEKVSAGGILFLPSFKYKTTTLRRLLREVLPKQVPPLFPPRSSLDWQDDSRYQFTAVMAVRERRRATEEAHRDAMEHLGEEEAVAKQAQTPFLAMLTESGDDLRDPVRTALEWLEFDEVIDEDDRRERAGEHTKEEDFQIREGDYFAVVEVTSGKGGARERDFEDTLKYIRRRQEHPGRSDIDPARILGLLVMNQHTGLHRGPAERPGLYEGNEGYQRLASSAGIGLLSTFELFLLLRLVDAGELTKAAARQLIKRPGLIKAPRLDKAGLSRD
jgi:hypothetical protein